MIIIIAIVIVLLLLMNIILIFMIISIIFRPLRLSRIVNTITMNTLRLAEPRTPFKFGTEQVESQGIAFGFRV